MKTIKILFSAFLIFAAQVAFSAPAPPPAAGGTGGPNCWPPPCIPVDNGIVFLIIAGGLLGAKKIYDSRKKAESVS